MDSQSCGTVIKKERDSYEYFEERKYSTEQSTAPEAIFVPEIIISECKKEIVNIKPDVDDNDIMCFKENNKQRNDTDMGDNSDNYCIGNTADDKPPASETKNDTFGSVIYIKSEFPVNEVEETFEGSSNSTDMSHYSNDIVDNDKEALTSEKEEGSLKQDGIVEGYNHFRSQLGFVYPCMYCGLTYSSLLYQVQHEKICKKNKHSDRDWKYECEECAKKFKSKDKLNIHKVTHTGIRIFTCAPCDKRFTQKCHLRRHINTVHNREKKYQCNICNKKFYEPGYLTIHKKLHNKESPFCCDVCKKTFSLSSNLNKHMKVHTGERPYCCSICDKAFKSSTNLSTHMIVHTGEKPFSCVFCDMKFTQASSVKTHLKKVHKQHNI